LDSAPDAFGWFNLGSSLLGLGDGAAAADAFDRAREVGLPWRMLWYQFGPFEAYATQGRWQDVAALATANLRNAGNLEESIYWRGRAHAAAGDAAAAAADYRRALELNPGFAAAQAALASGGP
jgi:tetratricopeptide (TPR) repeat protein